MDIVTPGYRNYKFVKPLTDYLNVDTIVHMFNCIDDSAKFSFLDEETAKKVAELFRAFSDTSRVRIISALTDREYNVTELASLVRMTESAVSHHLRGLRQLRLVQTRREGKEVYYRIDDEHVIELFKQGVKHVKTD